MTTYNLPVEYDRLSPSERMAVRSQYLREQKGKCSHCGTSLSGDPATHIMDATINWELFPSGFQVYPVHLHHSHRTGLTIGAIHMRCNAVLWQYHGE